MRTIVFGLCPMLLAALGGCASGPSYREQRVAYVQAHPGLAPAVVSAIIAGKTLPVYSDDPRVPVMTPDQIIFVPDHTWADTGGYTTFTSVYGSVDQCADGTRNVYNSHAQKIGTEYPHP